MNLTVTSRALEQGGIPQVQDTCKKQKTNNDKISAIGMQDEYRRRIIELVTDGNGGYELLK